MLSVNLLYENKEWKGAKYYSESESIIQDLGLSILFQVAARDQERKAKVVQQAPPLDEHIQLVMKQVMMTPLENDQEIYYRQGIIRNGMEQGEFTRSFYELSSRMMQKWEKLGKKEMDKPGSREKGVVLLSSVKLLSLYVDSLAELKALLREYKEKLTAKGWKRLCANIEQDFNDEFEDSVRDILEDMRFFYDNGEKEERGDLLGKKVSLAKVLMEGDLSGGGKFGTMKLAGVETVSKRMRKRKAQKTLLESYVTAFASEPTIIVKEDVTLEDLARLETAVVDHIMSYFQNFMSNCRAFFEELYVQSAFLMGCFNLYTRSMRTGLEMCYPKVCEPENLRFENLTEFSMATYKREVPVGNDCVIDGKMLLIVTGANQGGKSTFLRSIGVAQILLQCGMYVSARSMESGIFPNFFTHFTRREDSSMNSGRLDEELGRIDGIIRKLGKGSIVLLNESFATTTEEEGSVIAYDIIRAMQAVGVKVLTVTHLLTFAKKVYGENRPEVSFLSAERKADGQRTYKMVPREPELTSFGLDLYDRIITGSKEERK